MTGTGDFRSAPAGAISSGCVNPAPGTQSALNLFLGIEVPYLSHTIPVGQASALWSVRLVDGELNKSESICADAHP